MLWTLLGILLTASTVQAQAVSDADRFELFNACRPMMLVVEVVPSDAQTFELTERVQLAVESRLRAARLYTESWEKANFVHLSIGINVLGPTYSIDVKYWKWVTDPVNNSNGRATTWSTGGIGRLGARDRDPAFIIQDLSSRLDEFLANYLRVNDPACNTR